MARKYVRKKGSRAFYLPGIGYLDRTQERLVRRTARGLAGLMEAGLVTEEEARERILEILRSHRAFFASAA